MREYRLGAGCLGECGAGVRLRQALYGDSDVPAVGGSGSVERGVTGVGERDRRPDSLVRARYVARVLERGGAGLRQGRILEVVYGSYAGHPRPHGRPAAAVLLVVALFPGQRVRAAAADAEYLADLGVDLAGHAGARAEPRVGPELVGAVVRAAAVLRGQGPAVERIGVCLAPVPCR